MPSLSLTMIVNLPLSLGVAVSASWTAMVVVALYVGNTFDTELDVGVAVHNNERPSVVVSTS